MTTAELTQSAEWKGLLAAIVRAPGDDVPRLVAADWLEEEGHAEDARYLRWDDVRAWRYANVENPDRFYVVCFGEGKEVLIYFTKKDSKPRRTVYARPHVMSSPYRSSPGDRIVFGVSLDQNGQIQIASEAHP